MGKEEWKCCGAFYGCAKCKHKQDETEYLLSTDANKKRLLEAAEKLKGQELFKESNDRARKTLSEIKSLPIVEPPQRETFENKALKWWMSLSMEEQVEIGFKYDEPTFNLTLRAIMFEFGEYQKKG